MHKQSNDFPAPCKTEESLNKMLKIQRFMHWILNQIAIAWYHRLYIPDINIAKQRILVTKRKPRRAILIFRESNLVDAIAFLFPVKLIFFILNFICCIGLPPNFNIICKIRSGNSVFLLLQSNIWNATIFFSRNTSHRNCEGLTTTNLMSMQRKMHRLLSSFFSDCCYTAQFACLIRRFWSFDELTQYSFLLIRSNLF